MRRRVLSKEEAIDRKADAIERRESGLAAKEEELKKKSSEIARLQRGKSTGTGENLRFNLRTSKRVSFKNC